MALVVIRVPEETSLLRSPRSNSNYENRNFSPKKMTTKQIDNQTTKLWLSILAKMTTIVVISVSLAVSLAVTDNQTDNQTRQQIDF